MRLLLDACVLVPPVVRGALLAWAEAGGFAPLWSSRVLEEWARAAERAHGDGPAARVAAALMQARWPQATVTGWEGAVDPAGLPDPGDAHVLAAAMAGGAEGIVTFNTRDFPLRAMGAAKLARLHPDAFLRLEWTPDGPLDAALAGMGLGDDLPRALKRAGLPRLAKAVARRS